MSDSPPPWNSITGIVTEIKRCEKAGATVAAVAMAYICIDTMAFLAMPEDRTFQTKSDFISWADTYLKGHQDQPYQYDGKDVYAARCAVLHTYSAEGERHRVARDVKIFGCSDGGLHAFDPTINLRLVIIGTASFLNDVVQAVQTFGEACRSDKSLRERVEVRLPILLHTFPLPLSSIA